MKLFKGRDKRHFQAAELTESRAYLGNPGCGWYHIHTFLLQQEPDLEELKWCVCREETLALLLFDIGAYRNEPIPEAALQRMRRVLSFFENEGKQVIVRIVYDREGKGLLHEPDIIDMVETHMKQIGAVLRAYEETLLLVQGLFVGSWGELHGSKYLSKERLHRLWTTLRAALGADICMAVRTPAQWRSLFEKGTKPEEVRTGVFDDGMFGSESNLGTYGTLPREQADWETAWSRTDEQAFIAELSAVVPYGGEAVGEQENFTLGQTVSELRRTGASYLNCIHDAKRLKQWKQMVWRQENGKADFWNGCNGYEYIGCHLGYRFVVREAGWNAHTGELLVKIENTGFSTIKEETDLEIYCDAVEVRQKVDAQPMEWQAGQVTELRIRLQPELSGRIYLQCRCRRNGQILHFANEPMAEAVMLGILTNG